MVNQKELWKRVTWGEPQKIAKPRSRIEPDPRPLPRSALKGYLLEQWASRALTGRSEEPVLKYDNAPLFRTCLATVGTKLVQLLMMVLTNIGSVHEFGPPHCSQ